jgi:hypothetical protein
MVSVRRKHEIQYVNLRIATIKEEHNPIKLACSTTAYSLLKNGKMV